MNTKSHILRYWNAAKSLFIDYTGHSSIHGVSYITEKGRPWFERLWWVAVFVISFIGCSHLIYNAWFISPIIISFNERPTPIWQIPFPAVTVCPLAIARWNITKVFMDARRLSETDEGKTLAKAAFCNLYPTIATSSTPLTNLTDCNKCLEIIRGIRVSPEEAFFDCKFRNKVINCSVAFKETIVESKLCYTFNGLDLLRREGSRTGYDEWSIDEGYKAMAALETYPHRAIGAGLKSGLSFLLRSDDRYFDPVCAKISGYELEYRMPQETPDFFTNFFYIQVEDSVTFTLDPNVIRTSDKLRHYSVEKRQCYFSNERPLKYYSQYTQTNCFSNCLIETLIEKCGCVFVSIGAFGDSDVCGPAKFRCLEMTKEFMIQTNYGHCKCLPACSSISFKSEVMKTKLNTSTVMGHQKKNFKYSKVHIIFKDNHFMTLQRSERYGQTDFLANCGGLMGLFLGISVIGLLEIVYFCTVRLCSRSAITIRDRDELTLVRPMNDSSKRFLKITQNLIINYSSKTTIQGIKYLADTNLAWVERIWWTIMLGISIFCCGSLIWDTFKQYDQSPVIISYGNEEKSTSQIPFPAVTICPQYVTNYVAQMYHDFKVLNRTLYDFDEESINALTSVAQVCDPEIFGDIDPGNKTECQFCSAFLSSWMGDINSIFHECRHVLSSIRCSHMLSKFVTEDGVCLIYNNLPVYRDLDATSGDITDEWTLEGGYKNFTSQVDVYPRPGSTNALVIRSTLYKFLKDGVCKRKFQGFKVYLHLPNEAPLVSQQFSLASFKHYTQIHINPRVTVSDPELRDLAFAKRQCYFSDERTLRFFRYYTQNNCANECVVNSTLRKCGCLMFHMPGIPGVKFCGISDIKCFHSVVQQSAEKKIADQDDLDCHCFPTCSSISYDTEINNIYLTDDVLIRTEYGEEFIKEYNIIEMEIAFREKQFIALKRSRLLGKTEFLANCGGLLALFLGFSVITLLELIYFFTIRMICNLKRQFFG